MTPPGKPLGMSDFFALEAGEYLERLDALLQQSETPAADEFVRLARALRGSALMANQQAIAKAAAGVESLARALREGRRPWDAQTKQLAVRAIDDLKIFVRRAANWTQADSAKAEALGAQLDQLAGRPSRDRRPGPPGVRRPRERGRRVPGRSERDREERPRGRRARPARSRRPGVPELRGPAREGPGERARRRARHVPVL